MIALLLALALSRPYHHATIDEMPSVHRTHVQVVGRVVSLRIEPDGDLHIKVVDPHGHFVIAEIPYGSPLERPVVGTSIVVFGIRRFDDDYGHGFWEVHPVERWILAVPMGTP